MTHEFLQPFHQATLEQQMEWASIDQVLENPKYDLPPDLH